MPVKFSSPAATRRPALTQAVSPFQPAFPLENPHSAPSQTSSSRSSARIFRSRRDTPTCVNPSNFAVSACVFPRKPDFAAHSRNPFPRENPPCAISLCPVKRVSPSTPQEFSSPAATRQPALTQATSPFQPAFSRKNPILPLTPAIRSPARTHLSRFPTAQSNEFLAQFRKNFPFPPRHANLR